jgi:hypothetical protein
MTMSHCEPGSFTSFQMHWKPSTGCAEQRTSSKLVEARCELSPSHPFPGRSLRLAFKKPYSLPLL